MWRTRSSCRAPLAPQCRSAMEEIQTALGNVRLRIADTTAEAQRYKHCQGRKCGSDSSRGWDRTDSAQPDAPSLVALKLVEDLAASHSEFETVRRADQKGIPKHCAGSLQCPAYGRLAQ